MFVILVHYKMPLSEIDKYLLEHRKFLQLEYDKKNFVVSGPKIPRTGGVIISPLKDKNILENILKNDPFYVNELADYEILEFDPVLYHADFAGFIE